MRKVSNVLQVPDGPEMLTGLPVSASDSNAADWDAILQSHDDIAKFLFGPG